MKQRERGLPPRPSSTTRTIKQACCVTHRSIPTQSATCRILTAQEQARVTGFVPTDACNESTLGKGVCGVQEARKVRRRKTTQKQYICTAHIAENATCKYATHRHSNERTFETSAPIKAMRGHGHTDGIHSHSLHADAELESMHPTHQCAWTPTQCHGANRLLLLLLLVGLVGSGLEPLFEKRKSRGPV